MIDGQLSHFTTTLVTLSQYCVYTRNLLLPQMTKYTLLLLHSNTLPIICFFYKFWPINLHLGSVKVISQILMKR